MQKVSSAIRRLVLVLVCFGLVYTVIANYSVIFSKVVKGEIIGVERVTQTDLVIGGTNLPASQIYSYAVAVREHSGEIFTSSTEDRQWAVAKPGYCVEARFYIYPPWNLEKSDTYFNARLLKLVDCKPLGQAAAVTGAPSTAPSPVTAPQAAPGTPAQVATPAAVATPVTH
jgi:hypothetical protein